ncbi:MAG: carboxymuconolactone decarboxylase family protein [Pseudomonadota bacterium]
MTSVYEMETHRVEVLRSMRPGWIELLAACLVTFLVVISSSDAGATMNAEGKSERYTRGMTALQALDAEGAAKVMKGLQDIAPDMARFIIEFGYGDVYSRPALDPKSRQAATIAALTALGNAGPQLKFHLRAALNVGLSPQEIIEVMYVTTVFAGFPSGINGINAAREVFQEKGVTVDPHSRSPFSEKASRRERGLSAVNRTSKGAGERVLKSLEDIAPDLGDFIIDFSYGDVIARNLLAPKLKEIAMIAVTVAKGTMQPQMKVHVHAALNVGCTREEMVELMYHMAVYAGFPAALNGINGLREVLHQRDAQGVKP